jgi:membrane-associated phospholipid phosphatase
VNPLYDIDNWLFYTINSTLSNPLFDWIMPFLREKLFWLPVYIFLLTWGFSTFTKKQAALFFSGIALTLMLTDVLSSRVIKPLVGRLRPCNLEHLEKQVLERVACGPGYSFPSAHAANHFGLAFFIIAALPFLPRQYRLLLTTWAGSIAFAQVYVGVHFPVDVIAGALLGAAIGTVIGRTTQKRLVV